MSLADLRSARSHLLLRVASVPYPVLRAKTKQARQRLMRYLQPQGYNEGVRESGQPLRKLRNPANTGPTGLTESGRSIRFGEGALDTQKSRGGTLRKVLSVLRLRSLRGILLQGISVFQSGVLTGWESCIAAPSMAPRLRGYDTPRMTAILQLTGK